MQKTLKEYPSLILNAFKRFPLAIAFAFLSSIAFIYILASYNWDIVRNQLFLLWAAIYPVAAMLIALTTSLIQESRKSTRKTPQILTSVSWLVISFTLSLCFTTANNWGEKESIENTIICIYSLIGIALIYGPFWNQKSDNALWVFCNKIINPIFTSYLITISFSVASFLLLAVIKDPSKGKTDPSITAILLAVIFFFFTMFPILCMACIPSIDKCTEETPTLKNFVTTIKLKIKSKQLCFSFDCIKHIFLPLYIIFIVTVHTYDIIALLQWNLPTRKIFFLAIGALVWELIINHKYYPAKIKAKPSSEKKIARILPFTCLIPTITATIAIIQRISEYSITASLYYALGFCIFLCISLILDCIPKIILTKYSIIIFCAINTITLIGPFSITNVTRYVWLKNIEKTLVSEGYSTFPLSEKDTKKFFSDLWKKDGHTASIVAYQVNKLHSKSIKRLYQYFPQKSKLADISKKYRTINASVRNNYIHTMPENFSKFAYVDYTFKDEDLVTRNDTLFFSYPLKDIDSTSSKVFSFIVLKQSWLDKDIKILETEGAKFEVEYIRFRQWENEKHERERELRLVGMLFME